MNTLQKGQGGYDVIERALAWLTRQFDLTTSLLAAFAENDNRMDAEETGDHRRLQRD
jgi:hypothetical protein